MAATKKKVNKKGSTAGRHRQTPTFIGYLVCGIGIFPLRSFYQGAKPLVGTS